MLIDDPARFERGSRHRCRRACVAAYEVRRQVRHRDHRPHPGAGEDAARRGCWTCARPLEGGVQTWLAERPQAWRDGVEVVAMDGFTGFKTAAAEELPDAVDGDGPVPCREAGGDALDEGRRVQRDDSGDAGGRRIRSTRPVASSHRSGAAHREAAGPPRGAVRRRAACRGRGDLGHLPADGHRLPGTDRNLGKFVMQQLIDSLTSGLPGRFVELRKLGRTLEAARRRHPRVLRPARHQQRAYRGDQRTARAPPRLRPGLPEPHELHRAESARSRRIQTPPTPSNAMSLHKGAVIWLWSALVNVTAGPGGGVCQSSRAASVVAWTRSRRARAALTVSRLVFFAGFGPSGRDRHRSRHTNRGRPGRSASGRSGSSSPAATVTPSGTGPLRPIGRCGWSGHGPAGNRSWLAAAG